MKRRTADIKRPFDVGAVISPGLCLDLTTSAAVAQMVSAYETLIDLTDPRKIEILQRPSNPLLRPLDRAVIRTLHDVRQERGEPAIETVKAVFIEGNSIYEGSGFFEKTHIQIAVCNPDCIKGIFRVPAAQLRSI
jgi:hypothetical protein